MGSTGVRFVFDYVDPGSYLLHRVVEGLGCDEAEGPAEVVPHPFEMRPPPQPLIDPGDPRWAALWDAMAQEARVLDVPLRRPRGIVPWSRKAHELVLEAAEKGRFEDVHDALFRAHFEEGRDIGRVDALVEVAVAHGLDASETRAALDVDRHRERLEVLRAEALEWGVRGVPTLLRPDGVRLEGFRRPEAVRGFLEGRPASRDERVS